MNILSCFYTNNIFNLNWSSSLNWTNDKIYILGYNPTSYKLSNGNIVDTGDLNKMLGGTTGRIDKIIGIYNNFIYYTYSYNAEHFYGKISLDLNSVTIIQKDDLPKELNN